MKLPNLFVFLTCGLLVGSGSKATASSSTVAPWKKWVQNPPTVPVSIELPTLHADANTTVLVTLADGLSVGYGHPGGCGALTNGPTLFANLNLRREYLLTVVATNLQYLEMDLAVKSPLQMFSARGSDSVPKAYSIFVDHQATDYILAYTNCTYFSNSWVVEIRDQQGAHWLVDDQSNDPGPAPGDGKVLEIGPAKSLLTNRITIDWSVSLGRLYDGLAAGRLRVTESGLSRDAYTPKAIYYSAYSTNVRSQVELISAQADGSLRQAKAFQCFVDIIDPWTFSIADLTDLPSLANRLKTETNGVSLFLSNRLASATQQALTNYQGSGSCPEPLRSLLVHDLNVLIAGPSIYSTNVFSGVTLSTETQFLLGQNAQGADLLRLNRLLLQDGFTQQLAQRPYQTALNFYLSSQIGVGTNQDGVYTNISGSPYVAWFVRNPQPLATTNLQVVESRNGVNRTNSLVYTPWSSGGSWALYSGSGTEQTVETRDIGFVFGAATNRFETNAVRYASSSTNSYKCVENYQMMPWGWELVQTRIDPQGANLVTSFEFYTDTNDDLTFGKPSIFRYPDGDWEVRLYEHDYPFSLGMLKYVLRPFNGLPESPAQANTSTGETLEYDPWVDAFGGVWYHVYHFVGDRVGGLLYTEIIGSSRDGGFVEEAEGKVHYNYSAYGIGVIRFRGTEDMGKGLAGHEFMTRDAQGPNKLSYYQGGSFDEGTSAFTVNPNGAASGPDWRQAVVLCSNPNTDFSLDGRTLYFVSRIEGQLLHPESGGSAMLRLGRSTREATVYHNGSPVQQEVAVFTGVSGSSEPIFDAYQRYSFKNDSLGHTTNITLVDLSSQSSSRTVYEAGYLDANGKDGELLRWEANESGVRTEYAYDSLKRRTQARVVGITSALVNVPDVVTTTSYDASGRALLRTSAGGSLTLTNQWFYDPAGRVLAETSDNGLTTNYAYSISGTSGGQIVTATLPSGATLVREMYPDRRLKSVTGTGVVAEYHTYATNADFTTPYSDTTHWGSADSARWTLTGYNPMGLQTLTRTRDYDAANYIDELKTYGNSLKQPVTVERSGRATVTYQIDFDGQPCKTSLGNPSLAADGRITEVLRAYTQIGGAWFNTETNLAFLADNSAEPTVTSVRLERLSGFASPNILSELTTLDADTNATIITTYIDRAAKKVTEVTDVPQSTLNASNVTVNGLLITESTPTVAVPTRHTYDGLGRQAAVTSPLGFTASQTYNVFGQVVSKTDLNGVATAYEYYPNGGLGAGQLKCETLATGRKTYHSYTARGELYRTWGDVPYPEERVCSDYGELSELHTFRGGWGWSGSDWPSGTCGTSDVTRWLYQAHSGLLTNKTDAASRAVSYTYLHGMLQSNLWARGAWSAKTYNDYGDLIEIDYSDGAPSVFFNDYNRAGLPRSITDATGTSALTYDHTGRLRATACTDGLLAGLTVTNHIDPVYGRDLLQVLSNNAAIYSEGYGYDSNGRMGSVSSGIYSATYGYTPNSDLLQTTTCKSNTTTALTTTRTWDYGYRLQRIANVANGSVVTSHSYIYDWLDRRIQATLEDGSVWKYNYNDRNELIGAHRYWADWTPVSGQQYGYEFDNIGNRNSASSGGDTSGANLRTTSYAANSLNQYISVTTPGYEDIIGAAMATNGVTVNTGAADRKGEYFHREITIANSSSPVWQTVSVTSGTSTTNGGFAFPKNTQSLTYDADGNLTFDGIWTYEWDPENRLSSMSMTNTLANLVNSNRLRLEFVYDFQGRRISKTVKNWNGSEFANPVTTLFAYDGWNLLASFNSQLGVLNSFLWGQDLSGTMDQSGGVGGLLALLDVSNGQTSNSHFAAYDGSGNITAMVRASDSMTSARNEYSPFGEGIRATCQLGEKSPFRWSTKFYDDETALVYYGTRYYRSSAGRWSSRDSLEESGGANLYAFCLNGPVFRLDAIGTSSEISGELNAAVDAYATGGATLLAEVTIAVGKYNGVQKFTVATIDSAEGDQSDVADLFISLLNDANQMLSRDFFLIAHQSGANTQMHHIFPQEFREQFERAKINIDEWQIRLRTAVHQQGINGYWNADWRAFLFDANNAPITRTKLQMFRFAQMMLWKYGIGK